MKQGRGKSRPAKRSSSSSHLGERAGETRPVVSGQLFQPFSLDGQIALITGGGTGLGLGMARCLIAAGAKVVLVGRRKEKLAQAKAELGENALILVGDVTQLVGVSDLVQSAEKMAGPISILINNAGIHLKKPAEQTTDEEFAGVLQTHVFGAFALTREVGRRMIERGCGTVLFIASMASFMGVPNIVAYTTAKTACVGLVRALATEWGPRGIRVNAIAPGWIDSDMLQQALCGDPARRAKILGRTPLGQFGKPEDIGLAAVYLASPAARFVTGVVLPVDGGAVESF
jgi:NAD(P)-dependent dehydrogenase (short-subunit alcohol dehydrogenase family)